MNIVLPLGKGSLWQDAELRYCLRSVCAWLGGWDKLVLVGEKPDWLKPHPSLVHLPMEERVSSTHKERNIHKKIVAAIESGLAGDRFLFMNDDHFLLQPANARDFALHHKGELAQCRARLRRGGGYWYTLGNTLHHLRRFAPVYNYDTHCPIVYHSATYMRLLNLPDWPPFGYAIKTMYCTLAGLQGSYYPDMKLQHPATADELHTLTRDRPYFSMGNGAAGPGLWTWMEQQYPNKSPFE